MKVNTFIQHRFFQPVSGAALAALCGLALWKMTLGDAWENASYDYLFRFGWRPVTNNLVLILMDNTAHKEFGQVRGQPWDRALHTNLLNKLAADSCPLVVFDVFFEKAGDSKIDEMLAETMQRQHQLVLMAKQTGAEHRDLASAEPILPINTFLRAARTNWGVAWLQPDLDSIVRRHWPFPAPGLFHSLPWTAARLADAKLSEIPQEQWLRYYGIPGPWVTMPYHDAQTQATNYFRNKVVFIGNKPENSVPDGEKDEFRTPYTRWTGESVGGVEILATAFLNLMNGDWLRRPSWWVEVLVLVVTGILLGGVLCQMPPLAAGALAVGAGLVVTLGAIALSYWTNFWFPWLVIAGGQVPCALMWTLVAPRLRRAPETIGKTVVISAPVPASPGAMGLSAPGVMGDGVPGTPDTPDYELFNPPFGEGAFGRVWLARNAIGQWQALKAVYQAKFGENSKPYETEFRGIKRYKPISDKHPGLLRVDFVSRMKREGYFYYVMDLGDALVEGWQENPAIYKPRDLKNVREQAEKRRLPVRECVRIGIALADALDFLHRQGFTHRDIKPLNIIFVNGQPKLADVGLVTEIRPTEAVTSYGGTPGYMPPWPEAPGTVRADIYALGMVLYVISTGRDPAFFPELSTTLIERTNDADFILLNPVVLKACQPDGAQRYASAAEMHAALLNIQKALPKEATTQQA